MRKNHKLVPLSEEEKKAIEKFNNLYIKEFNGEPITTDDRLSYIEGALITNLIEKLEQELNSLKEIEKSHQEENGKLRVELQQKEQIIKRLEQDVDGYIGLSKQIQEEYSKQIRDYEEGLQ